MRALVGAIVAGGALPLRAGGLLAACAEGAPGPRRLEAIGIQLYTVRELMARDADRTLGALAGIGYREVELAGLYGKSAREMRALLDRHGLAAVSSHVSMQDIRERWARTLDDAATLGQRFVVCPWIDEVDRTRDGYRRVAAEFNRAGEAARRLGLRFGYHNHDYEFTPLGGTLPYDILLAECDSDLVAMEMDLFWVVKGGQSPLAYFASHPGRFPLVHVKDMARDGTMTDVGRGTIDFRAIFAESERAGIEHYFVEHDQPSAPLETARVSYEYLRRLGF